MRILMVSPFPPLRDGVGKYAAQEVAALREQGHEVEVLSPVPCAAHHVEDLKGGLRLLRVRRFARRYDRVILQYQPSHYHKRGTGLTRLLTNVGMLVALRTRNLVTICHEVEYPPSGWTRWRPEALVQRRAWLGARNVEFHTEREVDTMRERFGGLPRRVSLRDHGRYFRPSARENRAVARHRLGISEDVVLFLCIGFIQPHKGFDRAIRAVRRLSGEGVRLVTIGSVRVEEPSHAAHLDELRRLASGDERIIVREVVLTDHEFDRWIMAADAVLLPYREIWSSGVLERAKLLDRPVVASDVGGMAQQTGSGDVVVSDDEELVQALAKIAGCDVDGAGPQGISVEEAEAYVREEARWRRGETGPEPCETVTELEALEGSAGVHEVFVPSIRPGLGRVVTMLKRAVHRAVVPQMMPVIEQLNRFHGDVLEAFRSASSELQALHRETEELRSALTHRAEQWEERGRAMNGKIERLNGELGRIEEELSRLERRTREMVRGRDSGTDREAAHATPEDLGSTGSSDIYLSIDYHAFEARHRGASDEIASRQRTAYLQDLQGHAPVVDLGCGRGEFLAVLREAGIEAWGVDINLDMVADARSRGLEVVEADALDHLRRVEPGTLGGIFAAQFIEHLSPAEILALLELSRQALRPGGLLVLETINPQCLYALANWYIMDITHEQPVHPETLQFLLEQEGFEDVEVRYFEPARPDPPALTVGGSAPDWAKRLATELTTELRKVNDVLFGPQDYAAFARAPGGREHRVPGG